MNWSRTRDCTRHPRLQNERRCLRAAFESGGLNGCCARFISSVTGRRPCCWTSRPSGASGRTRTCVVSDVAGLQAAGIAAILLTHKMVDREGIAPCKHPLCKRGVQPSGRPMKWHAPSVMLRARMVLETFLRAGARRIENWCGDWELHPDDRNGNPACYLLNITTAKRRRRRTEFTKNRTFTSLSARARRCSADFRSMRGERPLKMENPTFTWPGSV